jgi:hypothetical protein
MPQRDVFVTGHKPVTISGLWPGSRQMAKKVAKKAAKKKATKKKAAKKKA